MKFKKHFSAPLAVIQVTNKTHHMAKYNLNFFSSIFCFKPYATFTTQQSNNKEKFSVTHTSPILSET
ncbi:CLUMA_CG019752, isoform A [Clunio marinus]|uniref:CLUMA_CG019752, isoform A n=1 Tax=Clunio marinus TaxID=568069 RepID=A0A1J1J2D5_9DIPT|nr:CLUMA_CG019752, isoform A [Clunio marinus]